MSLYNGSDMVALATRGTYTETYVTSTGGGNIASLYATWGLIEAAVAAAAAIGRAARGLFRVGTKLTPK